MNNSFQNLNKFLEEIKTIGFLQRIFVWGHVKKLSYDAYKEFNDLIQGLDTVYQNLTTEKNNFELSSRS